VPPKPNPDDARALGEALRQLRETVGMTQVEAGEAAEIRAQFVSEIERATRGVSWTTLRALLSAYEARLTDLAKLLDS
jgi:transcriptional regulator with XRE-family HTH domain